MSPPRGPTEEQIQAYIDDLLSGRDRAMVAAYLLDHPEIGLEVATLRRQNEALRQIGEEVLDEPIPERLRAVVRQCGRSIGNGVGQHAPADLLTAKGRSGWYS